MSTILPTASPVLTETLAGFDALDDQASLEDVAAAEQAQRRTDAIHAARIVSIAARGDTAGGMPGAGREELAWLLNRSSRSTAYLVDTSAELVSRPLVWDGLHQGLIDRTQGLKIVKLLAQVPDPAREQLEAKAIAYGSTHTTAQLHRKLLAMTCDNDPDETLRKQAVDNRGVTVIARGHGMTSIGIDLSAEHAEAFIQGLDRLATSDDCPDPHHQGQARTLDQRRADALTGFLDQHTTWDVHAEVTIPADMLLGVETTGADLNGSPITHRLAKHLAWSPDARWTRLVTDPLTGVLLDAGTTKYEIPKKLRDAVRKRDETCRWPGCTRKAEYTDTDHVTPYRITGHTSPDELTCLCRWHHRQKTFGNWKITTRSTYALDLQITAPLGTTRTSPPNHHRRD